MDYELHMTTRNGNTIVVFGNNPQKLITIGVHLAQSVHPTTPTYYPYKLGALYSTFGLQATFTETDNPFRDWKLIEGSELGPVIDVLN